MRVLVTRPAEDAASIAAELEARGIEPVLVPLMTIRRLGSLPDLTGIAALLFTSANGVRAFAAASERRDLPSFAVGAATAVAARAAGFAQVESADGNVGDLARLVGQRLDPAAGRLLHIAGSDIAGDLAGQLSGQGFTIDRAVLYEAVPIERLPAALVADFNAGRIDQVLLFSPRTATLFAERALQEGMERAMKRVIAVCLSPAVAEAATLPFAEKRVAARPEQKALLDLVASAQPERSAGAAAESHRGASAGASNPIVAGALAGLLVSSAIAAIAIATAPSWLPVPPAAAPAADPAQAARLTTLEQQLAQLRALPVPNAAPDLKPVADRLAALEQALAALRRDVATAGGSDQLASLQERLGTLEQAQRGATDAQQRVAALGEQVAALQQQLQMVARNSQGEVARAAEAASRRAAFALAASQLGQALAAGQPFAPALTTVSSLAEDPALKSQLATLQPSAERGIPTGDALARRLPPLLRDAKAADTVASAGGGWVGELRALAGRLVTIRPKDPSQSAGDLDNRLARAEAYIDSRDLGAAVAELKQLSAPAAAPLAAWLGDAERRLAAESIAKTLEAQAAAAIAGGAR